MALISELIPWMQKLLEDEGDMHIWMDIPNEHGYFEPVNAWHMKIRDDGLKGAFLKSTTEDCVKLVK